MKALLASLVLAVGLSLGCATHNSVPGLAAGIEVSETGAVTITTSADTLAAICAGIGLVSSSWEERFCPALDPSADPSAE